jgi:hypothetical protein
MACVRAEGGLPRTPKNAPSYPPHPGSVCMSPCDTSALRTTYSVPRSAQRTSRDTTLAHHVRGSRCRQRAPAWKTRGLTNCLKRENKRLHVVVPDPNFANGTANKTHKCNTAARP